MTERQRLIAHKLNIISVKRTLEKFVGIDVVKIFEENENVQLNELYSAYVPSMCSPAAMPYSRISDKATEKQIILWIAEMMGLKENTTYFFRCHGIWVEIIMTNLYDGIKFLWKHDGIGFLLADADLSRMMEVSFDSRDENNYLLDIWTYAKS